MASLDRIKSVMEKIMSVPGVGEHICFFGGSVPYIYYNTKSNRDHSDIDVLVDENLMEYIRNLIKSSPIYKANLDSLNLGLDDDYGLKVFIDGVYVEFEPYSIKDGFFVRKSFSPDKELAGVEQIPCTEISDMIVPFEINGKKSLCQSVEMIKVGKEQYNREKDLRDIEFIEEHGFDKEKYNRLKKHYSFRSENINTYAELRNKNKNIL